MKAFDKRKVPGLEDCSSESEDDDLIPFKKPFNNDDIEIEIEVQDNEFLKEEPIIDIVEKPKGFNNVWGNVVQENILNETFTKVGVNQINIHRNVESYRVENQERNGRKRKYIKKSNGHSKNNEKVKNVKERVEIRTYNKSKDRSHIQVNLSMDTNEKIVFEIARLLQEPKIELIEKCFNVLGKEKCLEFYYMTEDIEENGGLLVVNGSRRRTAGGVFLTLIKESEQVNDECKQKIFQYDFNSRKKPYTLKANKGNVFDLELDYKKIVVAMNAESHTYNNGVNIVNNVKKEDEEELEEGEIL